MKGGDGGMIGAYHARQMDVQDRMEATGSDDQEERAQVALAKRDPQAFAPLYARYFDAVYRYSFRRLRNSALAEDATSQIFLKALAALPNHLGGSFRSWLFSIARNVVIDMARQAKPHTVLPEEWDLPDNQLSPEEQAIVDEDRRRLWELLDLLTPEQRDVLELRLAGLTGQEIADQLGRSLAATKSLQWRAFIRLKHLLALEEPITQRPDKLPEGPSNAIS
jgi:RNA polymerase sigma-70 factor (ECF subfamily)